MASKNYDLTKEDDFEAFVRMNRRYTCEIGTYRPGLDPPVAPLDFLGSVAHYPRFKVGVNNNDY